MADTVLPPLRAPFRFVGVLFEPLIDVLKDHLVTRGAFQRPEDQLRVRFGIDTALLIDFIVCTIGLLLIVVQPVL